MSDLNKSDNNIDDLINIVNSIEHDFRYLLNSYKGGDYDDDVEQVELDVDDQIENLKSELLNAEDNEVNVFVLHSVYLERKLKSINIFIRNYIEKMNNKTELLEKLSDIYYMLEEITVFIDTHENFYKIQELADGSLISDNEIKKNLDSSKIIINHLRHDQTFKIYNGEADRFKRYAFNYEVTFYLLVVVMFVYFSGLTIYVPDFNIGNLYFGFPSKKVGSGNTVFYIQKISVLVLSSTLAAFLLKRSFMNRELFQEAYRVAQELETLPSYIEPFSKEIREKIRLDLAYKYFGREYNSGSNGNDKSSENSMAENIKANTEFLKALKDISISKIDKGKSEPDF
ncbi:hypothetical protein [Acinetobacter calcoaceticus]|uniref:hypothetical protein n=1 Tax=Acinetobacter calcoaceticus TaxID=471 RepID=UPI003AF705CE